MAGYAHAVSMAWPFAFAWTPLVAPGQPVWWLQLLALGLLAWALLHTANWRHSAGLGWAFATTWLTGTFWWLFISMHTYAGLSAVLAALAVVGLAGLLGLYYAAVCGCFTALAPVNSARAAIVFVALWLLAELARGVWLTGFGWGAAGYAHVAGPLAGYAPWIGAYGLCAVSAWLAMTLAQGVSCGPWQRVAAVMVLLLPAMAQMAGVSFSRPAGSLSVTLLQGNIPQDEKFQPGTGVAEALRWYGSQLAEARTALVVAPETAIPLLPAQLPDGYWAALQATFTAPAPAAVPERAALIGIPLGSYEQGYTNSVIGLAPGQPGRYQYDKHHLVPFGEFIPPLFKWFTEMMNIPLGDFNRGAVGQASFDVAGQRLAPHVCYEDLFGEELGARFIDPALAPTIFVNISNIGWFGDTVAIDQHLLISRMRALEFERPFVRATNTGATVIMDHHAVVTDALPRLTRGVLVGEVAGRSGVTPFAWWVSRFGLWPFWLLALGVLGAEYTVPGGIRKGVGHVG
jgi:apolipoprotein N-acyltransferase